MGFILRLLATGVIVVLLSKFLPGVGVDSFVTALWVAFVLGILNAILKPILVFLTLPATIISLGLFLFVINAVIILLAAKMVDGFTISSFWTALLFSIVLTFCQSIVNGMFDKR
ncbi:MAG: phage holin family protein [Flavobacteriaceae bacterium]|jgi:putative membrane protein|nr:phage holin family protein [Flavobacteriaceae bacterium]